MANHHYDVVVVGASFGGVAAALAAAADPNVNVALLEATDWIGGQATSQGVSRWDEASVHLLQTMAFRGNGVMRSEDDEIARLRRELKRVTDERDFLKKTAAYFAKESR